MSLRTKRANGNCQHACLLNFTCTAMCPRTVSRNLKSLNSHIGTFRTVSEGVCRILKVCPRQGVSLKFWSSTFTSEEEVTGQESEPRGIYPGHFVSGAACHRSPNGQADIKTNQSSLLKAERNPC